MARDLIYLVTPTAETVASGAVLPLTTISRRYGSAVQSAGSSVILTKPGYYNVTLALNTAADATGDITVVLRKSGVNVIGAVASETVGTATTEIHNITITAIVRVLCSEKPVTLTLVNESAASLLTKNIALTVNYDA